MFPWNRSFDSGNIGKKSLGKIGLHLNPRGCSKLAIIFIKIIKNLQKHWYDTGDGTDMETFKKIFNLKGILMQIWKSPYVFVLI